MTRRRSRLGEEERGFKVAPEGSAVFKAGKDDSRPKVYIPVGGKIIVARWPAATARRQTGEMDVVVPEVIDMASKPRVTVTIDDPYHLDRLFPKASQGVA